MLFWENVKIKQKDKGVYLSAETKKGDYDQYYSFACSNDRNFACCEDEAIEKFLRFYNKFET